MASLSQNIFFPRYTIMKQNMLEILDFVSFPLPTVEALVFQQLFLVVCYSKYLAEKECFEYAVVHSTSLQGAS